jgi:alpha-tubulin suppressor-like RCC1 family protein
MKRNEGHAMFRRIVIAVTTCVVVAVGLLLSGPSTVAAQEAEDSGPVWLAVSAGGSYTCGISTDHSLWCWGDNRHGQLGVGDTKKRAVPTQVGTGTDWVGLVAGNAHTCATRTDHTLWCWGWNRDGQLGIGSKNLKRTTPTRVGAGAEWAEVSAAGFAHTCGTRTDHTLWCWGSNGAGQLGLGDNTNRSTPTQVGTGTDWSHATAGDSHICATRADRTLWCWGDNIVGQLGLGDTTTRTTPTRVGTATEWAEVSARNGYHTCATRTDHTLWCWGFNSTGQLGLGDTAARTTPTRVGTDADWDQLGAGHRQTCGTRTDHTLWCWGDNTYGQLGLGDTTNRSAPTQVGTSTDWAAISSGARHTCATRTDHTLWCWGDNTYGQLGLGDQAARLAPTLV